MISTQRRPPVAERVQTIGDRTQHARASAIGWVDERARHWRLSNRHERTVMLWQALTSPFWFASELPKPALPALRRQTNRDISSQPAGQWFHTRLQSLEVAYGRSWLTAMLIRGVWLGLAAVLLWVVLALSGLVGLPARWVMIALPCIGGLLGFAFGWSVRPSAERIVGMLDRTFRLNERLTTATDTLKKSNADDYVTQIQLVDAANTLDSLTPDLPRPVAAPLRELWLLVVLITALFTGLFAWVPNTGLPQARESAVPAFVSAGERLTAQQEVPVPDQPTSSAPTVEEVQQQAEASNSTRSDLGLLSDALRNHPSTSEVSQAIDEGDYDRAADLLRAVAANADSMSQEERNALADDLDEKADQISEENPELAETMHEAADDLREGGPGAGDGLNKVADEIDKSSPKVKSQEELEQQLTEAEGSQGGSQSQSGQQQEGQQQGGEQGQEGSQSDPGEGVDAESGVVDEQGDPSSSQDQPGGESDQGGAEAGAGEAPEEGAATGEQGGEGEASGNPSDQQSGESGAGGETGENQQSGNDDQSTQGQGAGGESAEQSGDQAEDSSSNSGQGDEGEAEQANEGAAAEEPPPSSSQGGEGGSGGSVRNNDGEQLPLEGASDENLPAGNQGGTSSSGSGGGQGTASGDQAQGEQGVAGPDSNVVPEDMRDPVEDYFDGEGTQP